jgi:hypothetical protein
MDGLQVSSHSVPSKNSRAFLKRKKIIENGLLFAVPWLEQPIADMAMDTIG